MSHDPYSPCPCGSGKKLKFCCQEILPEMMRIEKLIENQPSAAEKLLDELLKKHSDKVFLVTHKASLLMARQEIHEARALLAEFLKRQPDEPLALLALADICLTTDGFENAKRIVHRAFQLVGKHFPDGVARLANRIASMMERRKEVLSVREHLALTVRMSKDDTRANVLMQLAYFESQRHVPYPLRGRFALQPVELNDENLEKEELRARRVSQIGCWEPAAIIYSRLVKERPDDPRLWHNLALFQAWDGRSDESIKSLRKSTELTESYEDKTEAEALAQLLEHEKTDDVYTIDEYTLSVNSLSEVITRLEDSDRFGAVQTVRDEDDDETPVREFEILRTPLSESDKVVDVIADVSLFDDDDSAEIRLVGTSAEVADGLKLTQELLGDLVDETSEPVVFSRMSSAYEPFDWKIHQAPGLSNAAIRKLDQERLAKEVDAWLETPLASLDNKAPQDAHSSGVDAHRVEAAVLVLDAVVNRLGRSLKLAEVRSRLNLPEMPSLKPEEDQVLTGLPLLQFHRLDVSSITDAQAIEFVNRVSLIGHPELMKKAVTELISRPEALAEFDPMRAHLLHATTARESLDAAQVVKSFEAARESVADSPDAFRTKLELDIRELSFRLDDPEDPELPTLLKRIRDQYFHKIPEIAEVIQEELASSGCLHLMEQLQDSSGSLWTPEKEAAAAGGGSKLWVPGQD